MRRDSPDSTKKVTHEKAVPTFNVEATFGRNLVAIGVHLDNNCRRSRHDVVPGTATIIIQVYPNCDKVPAERRLNIKRWHCLFVSHFFCGVRGITPHDITPTRKKSM